jgi:hypothetical protein
MCEFFEIFNVHYNRQICAFEESIFYFLIKMRAE